MVWIYCLVALGFAVVAGGTGTWLWLRKPQTRLSLLKQDILHRKEELHDVAGCINKIQLRIRAGDLPPDWLQLEKKFEIAQDEVGQAEVRYQQAQRLLETHAPHNDFLATIENGQRSLGNAEAAFKMLRKRHRMTLRTHDKTSA
jgi:hypothetical protein